MAKSPRHEGAKGKDAPRKTLSLTAIKAHCYNKDGSQVAVISGTREIRIYAVDGDDSSKWKEICCLEAHDLAVTSIDWGKKTDRLLSCSEDRCAFVWVRKDGSWDPQLVQLGPRCNRAALCCRWSPNENKFVVGSGAKLCHVCYYEEENNWWVSKEVKGNTSSVTCVEWKPGGNMIMASASTDSRVRLFSAYLKPVDGKGENPGKLGAMLAEHNCGAWVHDIAFSPSGKWLAAVAHDSSIHWINTEPDKRQTIQTQLLPFFSVTFIDDETCIAAGNDFFAQCYKLAGEEWIEVGRWMGAKKQAAGTQSAAKAAMSKFQDQATFGGAQKKAAGKTKHTNCISSVMASGSGFSTAGLDGCLHMWKMADMEKTAP